MVKKFRRYVYSFWRDPRTWQTDGQTDRHCMTAKTALASHRAVKINYYNMARRNKRTMTTNDMTVRCPAVLRVSFCEGWSGDQTLDTGRPCCRTRARGNRGCWCPRNHADLSLSSSVHQATACTIQTPPHSVAVISKWHVVFNAIKQNISNEGFDVFLRQET